MKTTTMTKLIVAVLGLSVLVTACSSAGATDEVVLETVAPADAAAVVEEQPEGLVVLDIRTPEEFQAGRIESATNVDYYDSDFAAQLDTLDKDVPYVMYCNSGNRSEGALGIMKDLGFTEVYEIDGGIVNWYQEGYPVEG